MTTTNNQPPRINWYAVAFVCVMVMVVVWLVELYKKAFGNG